MINEGMKKGAAELSLVRIGADQKEDDRSR